MLLGMDSFRDSGRSEALRRHLRAVGSCFDAPEAFDPSPLDATASGTFPGDDFARRQLDLALHTSLPNLGG